jgi:hypothetical protein
LTCNQPRPPLTHCAMVGDGCAGPPKASISTTMLSTSARSASRAASAARPPRVSWHRSPGRRRSLRAIWCSCLALQWPPRLLAMPLGFEAGKGVEALQIRSIAISTASPGIRRRSATGKDSAGNRRCPRPFPISAGVRAGCRKFLRSRYFVNRVRNRTYAVIVPSDTVLRDERLRKVKYSPNSARCIARDETETD